MMAFALLLVGLGFAIEREAVMDNAALFCTHEWTMGAANQYASCSGDYVSDYSPGQTYRGIPYDWGGFVTPAEFDAYLAEGYGAGSHSWHGVLWCTVGVDCSGFVSQAWETDQKYGTATIHQVSHEISTSALQRGDALNDAGSHIVLFAYETAAGIPVHIEANGELVFTDVDQGWSALSGYSAIRYDEISDGPETGTVSDPHEIERFPLEDLRWTAGAASDRFDSYSCAPDIDESGPEQIYHLEVAQGGTLELRVSCDNSVDVDIHVLDGLSSSDCLIRDHTELSIELEPGHYWVVVDTWVGAYEYAGPYILTGTFSGTLGDSGQPADTGEPIIDTGEPGADDTGAPETPSDKGPLPPDRRVRFLETGRCGCTAGAPALGLWLLGLAALASRRRR
jgi:MYXO-CTERM domain-containing protein